MLKLPTSRWFFSHHGHPTSSSHSGARCQGVFHGKMTGTQMTISFKKVPKKPGDIPFYAHVIVQKRCVNLKGTMGKMMKNHQIPDRFPAGKPRLLFPHDMRELSHHPGVLFFPTSPRCSMYGIFNYKTG